MALDPRFREGLLAGRELKRLRVGELLQERLRRSAADQVLERVHRLVLAAVGQTGLEPTGFRAPVGKND